MRNCRKLSLLILIFVLIIFSCKYIINYSDVKIKISTNKSLSPDLMIINNMKVRDFERYTCKNIVRVGGWEETMKKVPDKLYRIDGAWFVCFDNKIAPVVNKCRILSFGINNDYSFDQEFNRAYKCQVESFDPFLESKIFSDIRSKSDSLKTSPSLVVNENPLWRFHRIGIVGPELANNTNKIGWMATFDEILKYTKLQNKIIDVFKMDIEEADFSALSSLNIDYLCIYVKQFLIESHPQQYSYKHELTIKMLKLLRKLEQCFRLFKRDTRFFMQFNVDQFGSPKTEFQEPRDFKLELKYFADEIELINYMVTYGELYFINSNFL